MKEWIFNYGWKIEEFFVKQWESFKDDPGNVLMMFMGLLGGTVIAIALAVEKKHEKFYQENKRDLVGTVVGFEKSDSGSRRHPVVTFVDENGELQRMTAYSNGKCYPHYPLKAPIRITYLKIRRLGMDVDDMRVSEPGYEEVDFRITAWVLRILYIAFYLLMAFGIYRMFIGS